MKRARDHGGDSQTATGWLVQGEQLAAAVVAAALRRRGIDTDVWLPERIDLRAVASGGFYRADTAATQRRLATLSPGPRVRVVPGFYGVDASGRRRLWGRGGSDYSAAALAAALEATRLDLIKDVGAFHSCDPRWVPQAKPIRRMAFGTAALAARVGSELLHPRTIEPLREFGVPLAVRGASGAIGTVVDDAADDVRLVACWPDVALSAQPPEPSSLDAREPLLLTDRDRLRWVHTASRQTGGRGSVLIACVGPHRDPSTAAALALRIKQAGIEPRWIGSAASGRVACCAVPPASMQQALAQAHAFWVGTESRGVAAG